jgi:chemotaxis protein CheC
MDNLSDLEKDILKEMFSFGLAKSADSLSVISKETVLINIPGIEILDINDIISYVRELHNDASLIRSHITGEIGGETMLVFTAEQGERLAKICIGDPLNFEGNYLALKRSLLLEMGNILTGALVTQLANILQIHVLGTPPELIAGAKKYNFNVGNSFKSIKPLVLTVNTEFVNSDTVIEMPFIMVFDLNTVNRILTLIRQKTKSESNFFTK